MYVACKFCAQVKAKSAASAQSQRGDVSYTGRLEMRPEDGWKMSTSLGGSMFERSKNCSVGEDASLRAP